MDITLTVVFVVAAALASFGAGVFSAKKKFRSDILKLAVEASKHDFEAMQHLDKKYDMPMSVSLAFYVSYFTAIGEGTPMGLATNAGVDGMKRAVSALSSTNVRFYQDHEGIKNFIIRNDENVQD